MRTTLRSMARSIRRAVEAESWHLLSERECNAAIGRAIARRPHVQALNPKHLHSVVRTVKRSHRRRGTL